MPKPVLIVEDDAPIRESLRLIFDQDGYPVVTTSNGREALEWLLKANELPCIIFLDLMMPVMDGYEFMETLKTARPDIFTSVAIVVITAAPISGERETAMRPLVRDVVKKPFSIDHVLNLATAYCR